jgi:hypothetical protein
MATPALTGLWPTAMPDVLAGQAQRALLVEDTVLRQYRLDP